MLFCTWVVLVHLMVGSAVRDDNDNETYYESNTGECFQPLGMESGVIKNAQLSASSVYNANSGPDRGRLNIEIAGNKQGGWLARTYDGNQWLQIKLGDQLTKVTRVATQGRSRYNQWVKTYTLQYSYDGENFKDYKKEGEPTAKVFPGNTDQSSTVSHDLNPPIRTRFIRFRPVTWNRRIAMRVELYGCTGDATASGPPVKLERCSTSVRKSQTSLPIPSIPSITWLQTPSIIETEQGLHYQAFGRTINAKYLKERLKLKNSKFDTTDVEVLNSVKQLDIYADVLYVENVVNFYGVKTIKIYVREIIASQGSALVFSMPEWIQNFANAIGYKSNGDGTNGENGKVGIAGPRVDIVCDVITGELNVNSNGGNGHKGQDGGDGRHGFKAGDQGDAYKDRFWCSRGSFWRLHEEYDEAERIAKRRCNSRNRGALRGNNGGNGGKGGNAGKPGKGGDAGSVFIHYRELRGQLKTQVCGGKGAEPAKNGQGGNGGRGGLGIPGIKCSSSAEWEIGAETTKWHCRKSWRPAAGRGSSGRKGAPGSTPTSKGKYGMVSETSVRVVQAGTLDTASKEGFPKDLLDIIRRRAVDLLLGDRNSQIAKNALYFIANVTKGRKDLQDLKRDAERRIAFLGKAGFDIFGKNMFFVPLVKWESLLKGVKETKAAAESYEKAFNNVITDKTNRDSFQKMATLMSVVASKQVNAEKRRLIAARNTDETEKGMYVQAIKATEMQMKEMLGRIYPLMKKAQQQAQNKLGRDQALALLQGITGFASAISGKDFYGFIDTAVSIAENQVNRPCLTKLKSMIGSVKKWMTFGKYTPLADSSDLNFNKVDVASVPDIMQANLEINKERLAADLVCLLEEASKPEHIAPFKAEMESFFILGATRIEMIAKVMDLDNNIGGHNFDIPLLDDTEKAIKDLSKPPGASFSNTLRQTFMENLLATYRELERTFMEKLYRLHKALGYSTLWQLDDLMGSFRRVASESALGTGKLTGTVELTRELTKLSQITEKAERCFSKLRYTKSVHKWSFDDVNHKQMFKEIKKTGSTTFKIGEDQICSTCYNARLIKIYIELFGPNRQSSSVWDNVLLGVRHLSRGYFRAGDDKIKSYHQPKPNFRTLRFDRFTISDEQKCRTSKLKDSKTKSKFCVDLDDTRFEPMCSHELNGQTASGGLMSGKEECTSPSGYYELQIPVDKSLLCTSTKMRDNNCKDLDVSSSSSSSTSSSCSGKSFISPQTQDNTVGNLSRSSTRIDLTGFAVVLGLFLVNFLWFKKFPK